MITVHILEMCMKIFPSEDAAKEDALKHLNGTRWLWMYMLAGI